MKNPWLALTKPRLTALSVLSGVAGYMLAWQWDYRFFTPQFFWTLLGICLVGGGANSLNMLMEREHDAKMNRTKGRPLPSGKLSSYQVLAFGMTFSCTGLFVLSAYVNPLAGYLALMTLVSYILVYTPLKRKTAFNTMVGAITGALPPLIGYAAFAGTLDAWAYYLGLILFMWQMPHFFSLSWIYREDYRNAGYKMICTIDDARGSLTTRQTVKYTLFLLAMTMAPVQGGEAGELYLVGASLLGMGFLAVSSLMFKGVNDINARRVFRYSNIYLMLLMALMIVDRNLNNILESFLF